MILIKSPEGDGEEKEKITVTTERKDNQVTVSIKDTGAGMHPEILPRLFTKFASKSFAGTGLGLYISKSIIEEHGGKIWAENNSDGRGATFSFAIPKQQPYPFCRILTVNNKDCIKSTPSLFKIIENFKPHNQDKIWNKRKIF